MAVSIRRCRDHEEIASILRRDYFDDPVPHLGHRVIETFARGWIAERSEVYLLTAEADGAYAGFVFGHTLGPGFWRLFAKHHPQFLLSLAWVAIKMKFANKFKLYFAQVPASPESDDLEAQITALEIPSLSRPFTFAAAESATGNIPLVFVHPDHRGKGIAPSLLRRISEEMFHDGIRCVEAHIDLTNLSSVRAFLRAGFEVYRMTTNDFWARKGNGSAGHSNNTK